MPERWRSPASGIPCTPAGVLRRKIQPWLRCSARADLPELTGKVAEKELGKADITVNKNMVPFDSRTPFQTSGIRVGTPAITSRGFVEKDMEFIVNLIDQVLTNAAGNLDLIAGKTEEGREAYEEVLTNVRKQVRMKTNGMPLNRY